ncbi:hypothetical protein E2562_024503 [Oryza meyeriana var. granulata]|uniref:GIR1-like zinc ribbon domain-containing protein n=1 Tax=Oryza meyeriana var. granulata TaxID=110450 RepID=A0A6G1BN44_9ORYZ|nr:hypothetical protein E2562_024503 [Oryza meyeriana var. granulata]
MGPILLEEAHAAFSCASPSPRGGRGVTAVAPQHDRTTACVRAPRWLRKKMETRRTMSRSNVGNGGGSTRGARLELQLNLSPPVGMEVDGNDDSDSSSPTSCVSSDGRSSAGGSPGEKSPMVIGACTRCLMYCMVAKKDYPTCINCKQPSLVDLLQNQDAGAAADADADKKRGKRK